MERLVTRIGNEPAVPTEFDMDFAFDLDKETFDKLQRIFNRLCDLTDILGDDYDLDRLKEMVEADKEGKCVVMPCKPGDTVYYIGGLYNTLIKPVTVEEVYVGDGVFSIGVSSGFTIFTLQESEWYKTEKEAESALEKMKEGK